MSRCLLVTLALLLWAVPAQAQFGTTVVTTACAQDCGTTDDFTDGAITIPISANTGDLIVLVVHHWRGGARTLTSAVCGADDLTTPKLHEQGSRLWTLALLATASRTTCTVTLSGANTSGGDGVTALVTPSPLDPLTETGTSAGASTSATTTHGSGTVTPGAAPVLFVGVTTCTPAADVTGDSGFTNVTINNGGGGGIIASVGYLQQSDTTAQSWDATTGANETCETSLTAFQGASGGGGTPVRKLTLLGVGQ